MFRAIVLNKENGQFTAATAMLDDLALPAIVQGGEVVLRIDYSTLNYKDALALTDRSPIVRNWPMIPGIDGAGTVESSNHPDYRPGDKVVLNGWGVGEAHWGCLAQKGRFAGSWLIPLPAGLTTRDAMAIGTAGYTAMLCVLALEEHGVKPESGEILVTGASGGVGSIAIAVLARLGYRVAASTGKLAEAAYLQSLGATEIIDRATLGSAGKPLQKERWAGVIDSVGSHTLANACAQTKMEGSVAACGLAQGMDFPTTVAPFILRGVKLLGINSVMVPKPRRMQAWERLARDLDLKKLSSMTREIGLAEAAPAAAEIIAGKVRGRLVVNVNQ